VVRLSLKGDVDVFFLYDWKLFYDRLSVLKSKHLLSGRAGLCCQITYCIEKRVMTFYFVFGYVICIVYSIDDINSKLVPGIVSCLCTEL